MDNNITNPDDLFDDLNIAPVEEAEKQPDLTAQIDNGIEIISESRTEDHNVVEVQETVVAEKIGDKSKKHKKTKDSKESVEEVIKQKDKVIAKLTGDLEKANIQIEELKEGNTLIVDVQNTDERKKLYELMDEGKILADKKGKPFILAEQVQAPHNPANPPIHKIFLEDIKSFFIRKYYQDLTIMEAGNRTLGYKRIWCHHNGYCGCDLITEEQLQYCVDQGCTAPINYVHADLATGESFFVGINDKEPTLAEITKEIDRRNGIAENMNKRKITEEEAEEDVKISEEVAQTEVQTQEVDVEDIV